MDSLVMRRPHLDDLPEMPPLSPGYLLRETRAEDEESLADLLHAAFPESVWTAERVRKEFTENTNVKKTLVIEKEGLLVATSTVLLSPEDLPGTGIVHWVGGAPSEKGRRLGYRVVLATLYEFVKIGCNDALLRTDDMRLPAIKTYLNLGFTPKFAGETHPARWETVYAQLGM